MADPVSLVGTMAAVASGVSSVAGGIGAMGQARAERRRAEENAYIGRTRAIQTGAAGLQQVASEMATMRAAMAANGQMDGGVLSQALWEARASERRIGVANEMSNVRDQQQEARNASARGRMGFIQGALGGARSAFDIYQIQRGPQ